ncbi:MAG: GNAT family N-acetyltransferase [Clostridia bacterium]|nr:GNAT family N-acetyltransferase [Clostridia bacterium]
MLTFRDAQAWDAALISHIYARSWRVTYRGLIADHYLDRLPDEYWVPSIRSWLESGQLYGLIAMQDNHAVGCVIYGRGRDDAYGEWGEIVSLYLLPEVMRQGIGSRLLEEARRLLKEDGYHRCYLWAIEGNALADGFYRKHGFCRTDERIAYKIGGEDVADVRYVREG